jgi:nucleotide-binding universal stress UspA family protein
MLRRMLLCIDGEEHTDKAVEYALQVSKATGAELTVLHVVDGFLLEKRISHEIYAVGRDEYRAYVKKELHKLAEKYIRDVKERAEEAGVKFSTRLRSGHPVEEVLKEIRENAYDLVIMGDKADQGLWRLKSRNLPLKVFRKSGTSVMVVR